MRNRTKIREYFYLRDRAAGRARLLDAEPTRARLAELAAAHVPARALARAAGISHTAVRGILAGDRVHVQRVTAARIAALSLQKVYDELDYGHVPRIGAVRRIQALMAMGWTHDALAARGAPTTSNLLTRPGHLITLQTWRDIKDLYDQLSMTPGPSIHTQVRARALGYAPPLAWDERTIDDPTSEPAGITPVPNAASRAPGDRVIDPVAVQRAIDIPGAAQDLTAAERDHAIALMAGRGANDTHISDRLGVSERTVLRTRQRDGIPPRRARHLEPPSTRRNPTTFNTFRAAPSPRTLPMNHTPQRRPIRNRLRTGRLSPP